MDMQELRMKIQASHDQLRKARQELLEAKEYVIEGKEYLKNAEAGLVLQGIPGKNEGERTAFLRQETIGSRTRLLDIEKEEMVAQLALELALDERRLWESMLEIEKVEAA